MTLPLRILEKIRFQKKIKNTIVAEDPIFIIGCYRTGTTLLHILLTKDKQFGYFSNLDTFTALYNLSSKKIAPHIVERNLPETRPMDDLEMVGQDPQEETYAVSALFQYGAPNIHSFPQNFDFFAKYSSFEQVPATHLEKWRQIYQFFIRKATFKHQGKQLVLKIRSMPPESNFYWKCIQMRNSSILIEIHMPSTVQIKECFKR